MAKAPLPPLVPCDEGHFQKCLFALLSNLPKRNSDDDSGKLLVNTYRRMLGHLPKDAISHITTESLRTCKWFPTIAECLEIAKGWSRGDTGTRDRATAIVEKERRARWDDLRQAIRSGVMSSDEINALPDRVKLMLDTENLIRIDGAGRVLWVQPAEGNAA